MSYVDGFLIVLPTDKLDDYWKMATDGRDTWMKHGALDYKECLADDMNPEHVQVPFPVMAKAGPNETVVFSFIVFKSREHRDEVNAKVHAEFSEKYPNPEDQVMPFDMNKMSYGGFVTKIEA